MYEFYLSIWCLRRCALSHHENRYVRDISSHRRLAREAPNNSTVQSISTLPTSTSSHLPHFNSSRQHDISKVSKSSSAAIDSNSGHRIKRQSAGREQLCQTTYQYITPQAALNSQGKRTPISELLPSILL